MRKLDIVDDHFYQDDAPTYTASNGFPDADSRLIGLLLNHRVINGVFDDLSGKQGHDDSRQPDWTYADTGEWDRDRNTRSFVQAMASWREHGVIAFTIGLQGGNPFAACPPPQGRSTRKVDSSAFNPDGSLRLRFMTRLSWILDEARRLDMVPIVNLFYQGEIWRIREDAIGDAVSNALTWLLQHDYDGIIVDLANECDARAYPPPLRPDAIHEMIFRAKDEVDLYAGQTGRSRHYYVGSSLTARCTRPDRVEEIPDAFYRAVDLLLPHGNLLSSDAIRLGTEALKLRSRRASGRDMPIVFNEDIQATPDRTTSDYGGDLEHLDACLSGDASWGNLIRSHQRVPCHDWFDGSEVQRAWFARARELAGEAAAPSSDLHFYHRI